MAWCAHQLLFKCVAPLRTLHQLSHHMMTCESSIYTSREVFHLVAVTSLCSPEHQTHLACRHFYVTQLCDSWILLVYIPCMCISKWDCTPPLLVHVDSINIRNKQLCFVSWVKILRPSPDNKMVALKASHCIPLCVDTLFHHYNQHCEPSGYKQQDASGPG